MKNYSYKLFLLFMIAIQLSSCTNDSLSDLSEIQNNEDVSYARDVKPIMDNRCVSCHGNPTNFGAPNSLTTYENVKSSVLNNLIDRISRPEGTSGAMPLGGTRLTQNEINVMIAWQSANFPQ
jgi:uncharacterized membrane protein